MTVRVFELRGVFLFRYDGEVPPGLAGAYNETADRYEVAVADDLELLPEPYEVVTDVDRYRVEFRGDPPGDVTQAALFLEDGPMATTVLCPDEACVEQAVEAGGRRIE